MEEREEKVTIMDFERELKKRKIINFFKEAPGKVWKFACDNWEKLVCIAPGVFYLVRRIGKGIDGRREDHHRNYQVYDHSLGMWHDLKRAMTAKQKKEFAERRKRGESVLEILSSMGLLKK